MYCNPFDNNPLGSESMGYALHISILKVIKIKFFIFKQMPTRYFNLESLIKLISINWLYKTC